MSNTRQDAATALGRRPRASGVLIVVALVIGLTPGLGGADEYGIPGKNGAVINVGRDGYGEFLFDAAQNTVSGANFIGDDVAVIFQCPVPNDELRTDCAEIGTTPTGSDGAFTNVNVVVSNTFVSPLRGQVNCFGNAGAQCSVVAATYARTDPLTVTSQAEHYICFRSGSACLPKPEPPPTTSSTTTTTVPQPEWEPTQAMDAARQNLAVTRGKDGRIYAIGGHSGTTVLATAEVLDTCGPSWSALPPLATARTLLAAATDGAGRIYAIGGSASSDGSVNGLPLSTVEMFDPAQPHEGWRPAPSLNHPRYSLAATTGPDGRIYAIGGDAPNATSAPEAVPTVEAFDPQESEAGWQLVTPLPAPENSLAAATSAGKVHAVGGLVLGTLPASTWAYTPPADGTPGTWSEKPPVGRSQLATATVPDGRIFATGGFATGDSGTGIGASLDTVETYDPATGAWTEQAEKMRATRFGHGSAVGADGRLYVIGGRERNGNMFPALATTEALEVGPSSCDVPPPTTTTSTTLPPTTTTTIPPQGTMTLTLDPPSIAPDGTSTSVATATVYEDGLDGERVCFSTDGDVTFSAPPPDHCGTRSGERTWTATITASRTPGVETITAHAVESNLTATAVLDEGGSPWTDRTTTASAPTPLREEAGIAYDEASGLTVLFGGSVPIWKDSCDCYDGYTPLGDTWVFDGSRWTKVLTPDGQPVPGPSPRRGAAMAYDASSQKVLLFGGHDGSEDGYLGDTWTFSGGTMTWTRHDVPGPPPRYVTNMASDGVGVVMFSGTDGWAIDTDGPTNPDGPGHLRDTWTWRNGAWTEHNPQQAPPPAPVPPSEFSNPEPVVVPLPPPPPGCPGVTCPPDTAEPYPSSVTVSGLTGKVADVDVSLTGLTHTQSGPADLDIMVVAPSGESVMVMSDACGDEPVSAAGALDLLFDDSAPARLTGDPGCGSGRFRPTDVETGENTPFHQRDAFSPPAPAQAAGAALGDFNGIDPNGKWSLYVVDDGPDNVDPLGEAGRIASGWKLRIRTSDTAVVPPTPAASPPPRGRGAMAYHPPSGKVLLFGGTEEYRTAESTAGAGHTSGQPFDPMGDTWIWDPGASRWSQAGAGPHPGDRRSAAVASQPASGNLVLFGGSPNHDGTVGDPDSCPATSEHMAGVCTTFVEPLNDSWTWDGRVWSPQAPPLKPPAALGVMAADRNGRAVLVPASGPSASTWTWHPKVTLTLGQWAVPADGASTVPIVVTVQDGDGQPAPGLAVEVDSDDDATFSPVVDRGDGTYSTTLTASTTGGIQTVVATSQWGSASASLEQVAVPCGPGAPTTGHGDWRSVADMPTARLELGAAHGGDGRIYTFGGKSGETDRRGNEAVVNAVEQFDPCAQADPWRTLPSMPGGPRAGAAVTASPDGRVYVAGGFTGLTGAVGRIRDLVEVYTPGRGSTPGTWQTLPLMPTPRYEGAAAVSPGGDLYLSGGLEFFSAPRFNTNTVDVYSAGSGRWTAVPPLSQSRSYHASATGSDGRIYAMGGATGPPGSPEIAPDNSAEAWAYSVEGGWERVTPMSNTRLGLDGAVGASDGLIYVAGGTANYAGFTRSLETVEAFAACADLWLPVSPMPIARVSHAVAAGPDGRIYVMGGTVGSLESAVVDFLTGGGSTNEASASAVAYTIDPDTTAGICPSASVDDVTVGEDVASPTFARFTVTLSRPALRPIPIDFRTEDGTAQAGLDYAPTAGTLTFAPGETSKIVDVTVHPDTAVEQNEEFRLRISAVPAFATLANAVGVASIVDAILPRNGGHPDPDPEPDPDLPSDIDGSGPTVDENRRDDSAVDDGNDDSDSGPPAPLPVPPLSAAVPAALLPAEPPAPTNPPTPPGTPPAQSGTVVVPVRPEGLPQPLSQPVAQAQAQAQQQAQHQPQQQLQQQAQAQASVQAAAQAGMMSERQREAEAERAYAALRDASAQVNLASSRQPRRPSTAPVMGIVAALMATGFGLARRPGNVPGLVRDVLRQPSGMSRHKIRSLARR